MLDPESMRAITVRTLSVNALLKQAADRATAYCVVTTCRLPFRTGRASLFEASGQQRGATSRSVLVRTRTDRKDNGE